MSLVILAHWGVYLCIGFLVEKGDLEHCVEGLGASGQALAW